MHRSVMTAMQNGRQVHLPEHTNKQGTSYKNNNAEDNV